MKTHSALPLFPSLCYLKCLIASSMQIQRREGLYVFVCAMRSEGRHIGVCLTKNLDPLFVMSHQTTRNWSVRKTTPVQLIVQYIQDYSPCDCLSSIPGITTCNQISPGLPLNIYILKACLESLGGHTSQHKFVLKTHSVFPCTSLLSPVPKYRRGGGNLRDLIMCNDGR